MTEPTYDPTLTDHLQLAGELIALKSGMEEKVAWIRFLLTEMQSMMPKKDYIDLLNALQEQITGRLAAGRWQ